LRGTTAGSPAPTETRDKTMHSIFYIIGVIVVVLFVLSFLGIA
jgi:hypothetical protein